MNELEPVFLRAIHMKIFVICHFGPLTFHTFRPSAVVLFVWLHVGDKEQTTFWPTFLDIGF